MRSRAGIDPDRPAKLVSRLITTVVLLSVWPASGVAQSAGGGPELVVQTAHAEFVRAAAFSADGRFLATGGKDNAVKIWDTASGFAVRTLTGFPNEVDALAFSRDGTRLATASWLENTVEFFEVATGRHQDTLDLKKEANGCADSALAIAFSHDDRRFAVAGRGGCVVLRDRSSGGVRPLVGHKGRVYRVAFSDDDRSLASLAEDNNVIIWDVAGATATRTVSLPPHPSATNVFALSPAPGGGWLAAGAYGSKAIALWQIDRAYAVRASRLDGHKDFLTSLAFSPDGRWLASGAQDATARIWEVATGHQRFVLEGHSNEIEGLAFNRDATGLATASWDGQVKLWDLGSGREVRTLGGAAFNVHAVAFAPDGHWLASASQDGTIKLWDLDNGVLAGLLRGSVHSVENLAFRPDGRRLAATRADGTIAVWDVPEWRLRYSLPGHRNVQRMPFPSAALAFSADGKWLAAADGVQDEKSLVDRADRTLKIRDAESGRELRTLVGHSHIIDAVAISPDRKWIATACRDHSVRIWDAATGRAVHVLDKHVDFIGTLAFSADGALLAVGSQWRREITLVDVASGRDVRTLEHGAGIHSLVFIHGGQWLASEASDDTVKIWEVASGKLLRTIQLTDGVHTIAFSPDERWIASATRDGTTRILDVASGEEQAALVSFYPGSDWLAIAPDGLFDGTADAMQQVAWRKAESNDTSSLDAFFTDFFHPGLLAEISAGRRPKARIDLATSLQVPGLRTMLRNKLAHLETHGDHVVVCFEQKPGAVLNIGPTDQRVVFPAVDGYEPGTTATCKFEKRLPTAIGNAGTIEQMQDTERATTPWDGQTSGAGDATLHVLTVAVSSYLPTSGFEPLPYAVRSAKAVEAFFRDQQANRKLYAAVRAWDGLYDADATRANLRKRLSDMADKMTEKDVVLIYMAGHGKVTSGEEMFYFVPSDGRDEDLRDTGVSAAMLAEGLRNLPARRVVLILDSCQSGGAIESLAKIASVKALAEERRVRQAQPAGRDVGVGVHVIAATLPLAYAVGLTEGQSVLAETILRVLHRAGQPLTAGRLADDLKSELPAASERAIHGFRQVPLAESVGLDFPLAAR
jgi:WD40 repeat protein